MQQNDSDSETPGCEKGKLVMTLNFSPVQFINAQLVLNTPLIPMFESAEKHNLSYEKVFIATYQSTIWQPPKKSIS